jgi:hypothetical protein
LSSPLPKPSSSSILIIHNQSTSLHPFLYTLLSVEHIQAQPSTPSPHPLQVTSPIPSPPYHVPYTCKCMQVHNPIYFDYSMTLSNLRELAVLSPTKNANLFVLVYVHPNAMSRIHQFLPDLAGGNSLQGV